MIFDNEELQHDRNYVMEFPSNNDLDASGKTDCVIASFFFKELIIKKNIKLLVEKIKIDDNDEFFDNPGILYIDSTNYKEFVLRYQSTAIEDFDIFLNFSEKDALALFNMLKLYFSQKKYFLDK